MLSTVRLKESGINVLIALESVYVTLESSLADLLRGTSVRQGATDTRGVWGVAQTALDQQKQTDRQRARERARERERERERETARQTERQRERQTDRQTCRV